MSIRRGQTQSKPKLPSGVVHSGIQAAPPLKTGWLYKRSQGLSKLGRVNWKKRWFTLHVGYLRYYSSEVKNETKEEPKGTILLPKVTVVQQATNAFGKSHLFQIVHEDAILYCQGQSATDVDEWITSIRQLCSSRYMKPLYHPGYVIKNCWTCCNKPANSSLGCTKSFDYMKPIEGVMPHVEVLYNSRVASTETDDNAAHRKIEEVSVSMEPNENCSVDSESVQTDEAVSYGVVKAPKVKSSSQSPLEHVETNGNEETVASRTITSGDMVETNELDPVANITDSTTHEVCEVDVASVSFEPMNDGELGFDFHGGNDQDGRMAVVSVEKNSPAYLTGNLAVGDILLEVCGRKVAGLSKAQVLRQLYSAAGDIDLKILKIVLPNISVLENQQFKAKNEEKMNKLEQNQTSKTDETGSSGDTDEGDGYVEVEGVSMDAKTSSLDRPMKVPSSDTSGTNNKDSRDDSNAKETTNDVQVAAVAQAKAAKAARIAQVIKSTEAAKRRKEAAALAKALEIKRAEAAAQAAAREEARMKAMASMHSAVASKAKAAADRAKAAEEARAVAEANAYEVRQARIVAEAIAAEEDLMLKRAKQMKSMHEAVAEQAKFEAAEDARIKALVAESQANEQARIAAEAAIAEAKSAEKAQLAVSGVVDSEAQKEADVAAEAAELAEIAMRARLEEQARLQLSARKQELPSSQAAISSDSDSDSYSDEDTVNARLMADAASIAQIAVETKETEQMIATENAVRCRASELDDVIAEAAEVEKARIEAEATFLAVLPKDDSNIDLSSFEQVETMSKTDENYSIESTVDSDDSTGHVISDDTNFNTYTSTSSVLELVGKETQIIDTGIAPIGNESSILNAELNLTEDPQDKSIEFDLMQSKSHTTATNNITSTSDHLHHGSSPQNDSSVLVVVDSKLQNTASDENSKTKNRPDGHHKPSGGGRSLPESGLVKPKGRKKLPAIGSRKKLPSLPPSTSTSNATDNGPRVHVSAKRPEEKIQSRNSEGKKRDQPNNQAISEAHAHLVHEIQVLQSNILAVAAALVKLPDPENSVLNIDTHFGSGKFDESADSGRKSETKLSKRELAMERMFRKEQRASRKQNKK